MTSKELAGKIVDRYWASFQKDGNYRSEVDFIESLLGEALNEASAGMQTTMTDIMNRRIDAQIQKDAEIAAKFSKVDHGTKLFCEAIAKAIRAQVPNE